MKSIDEQIKIISKGVVEIINLNDLDRKLRKAYENNKSLIIKLGLDPTAPDIHLGHTVVLRKARQFQDLGHKIVIIIGDFTAMIGDPTGKSKARKQLSKEQVLKNAETYKNQIDKILDLNKTGIRFNSEWLEKLNFEDVLKLSSKFTVARVLEREDFKNRYSNNQSIGLHEFFYPLMQGYDSVELKSDIELGGTDQKFNILLGRNLQKEYGQEGQVAIFMPILEGTDGIEKMSKSLGNYVAIDESPENIYGKIMSIPDNLIVRYFELVTDIHPDELSEIKVLLTSVKTNPRDIKMRLALDVTTLYHGDLFAKNAEEHFKQVFQKRKIPENIQEFIVESNSIDIIKLLISNGVSSNSEAKRLINQGGVRINGIKLSKLGLINIKSGDIIQIGKMKFIKLSMAQF